ncbi:pilus assembly protein TadG-related protein [Nocardioides terrisoli]|uniref:pilus assembly protein TadG-related protein n=1 Tax=Nocardioides terrisoli TaxID=3388267 RepID=UPI00287B6AEE|nr:pilus assembly protein TadG-related protein [Nocardioides marmorisolisilvae]
MKRHRREAGAVAIMMALIICFVLVPVAAFTVDIGMQRVARGDMQSLADVVALDLSRHLDGTTGADALLSEFNGPGGLAEKSAANNLDTVGDNAVRGVVAQVGTVDPAKYGTSGYFTPITGSTVPSAVRVTASTTVGFGLAKALPGGGIGSGGVSRSAIATASTSACFRLGSFAARINSADSTLLAPLNEIFGVNLGLVDYKGLATETVTLADLGSDSHIGSVDQLLTGGVTYNDLALAALDVVSRNDPSNTVAISALNKLVQQSASVGGTVKLGDTVISASPSDPAALATELNLLDILTGTVLAADGTYGLTASDLQVQVPGLGNVASSSLKVTQAAQQACGAPGKATATASQLSGTVVIPAISSSSVNLPGPGPTLKTQTASATLSVNLGNAEGVLADPIVCGSGTAADPDKIPVDVTAAAGTVALSAQIPATLDSSLTVLLSLYSIHFDYRFNVNAATTVGASSTSPTLTIPPNDVTPVTTGSAFQLPTSYTVNADPTATIVTVKLLGVTVYSGPLSGVTSAVGLTSVTGLVSSIVNTTTSAATTLTSTIASTVSGLIGNLNTLLAPWSAALGVRVGGADVYAVKSPSCDTPQMVG